MCQKRLLPYWFSVVLPKIQAGDTVLIVSHANSLRALVMYLDNYDENDVQDLHIPTGLPVIYEFNAGGMITARTRLESGSG
jgi:2,3-bisphosphoglycerate-dependent phosphoglycerate mutase